MPALTLRPGCRPPGSNCRRRRFDGQNRRDCRIPHSPGGKVPSAYLKAERRSLLREERRHASGAGRWIGFVDADDWVAITMYSVLHLRGGKRRCRPGDSAESAREPDVGHPRASPRHCEVERGHCCRTAAASIHGIARTFSCWTSPRVEDFTGGRSWKESDLPSWTGFSSRTIIANFQLLLQSGSSRIGR